jgi:SSS family solute:Na+ symporter
VRWCPVTLGCLLATAASALAAEDQPADGTLRWRRLPDLPRPLSGQFVGTSNGALIVAGGTNFPVPLFQGGTKAWYHDVYVLPAGADAWRAAGNLDGASAYGATVCVDEDMICIGGADADRHYASVVRLHWTNGTVERHALPELPSPCAYGGAATLGTTVYVLAGQTSPKAKTAMHTFWALDLAKPGAGWSELEPWPGPARILPAIAVQDGAIYLISGAELVEAPEGKGPRRYLTDAYRFRPRQGWTRIADVPRPVVAAEAIGLGQSHVLVFSGDDGANVDRIQQLKDAHPGFSRDVLAYHTITDTWIKGGTIPESLVTTTAVRWQGSVVVPGGEVRPGRRSASVYRGVHPEGRAQFSTIDYVVLGAYLAALVMMGVYFSRRENSTNDFFLAGQRVPWWAAGLSIFGTQLSAITFMAIPAKVYATDWTYILGNICIPIIAPLVIYLYLPFYRRLNITTAYEYLEKRFNLAARLFGSTAFILFQLGRMGIVLYLPAIALSAVTGINVYLCIVLMGVLCTIYTVLGGIEAVIWTDVLQVVVLMGGALLSLAIITARIDGGISQLLSTAWADSKLHAVTVSWDYTVTAFWVVFVGNLFITLGPYTTDQAVIQRYLTTRDEKQAAGAIWTNGLLAIPSAILFFSLGTALYVFYNEHPGLLNPALDTDAVFPWFISRQLPVGVSGLVIAGLFAAAMSTLDSSMNSMATAMVTDFYRRFSRNADDHKCLNLARWLTVLLGAFGTGTALYMAIHEIPSLWDLFTKVLGLLGGSLSGLFALGIFTRRANGVGGLTGAIVSVIVMLAVQWYTDVHFFLYAAVGVITCFVVGYTTSLVLPGRHRPLEGLTLYTTSGRFGPKVPIATEG